MFQCSYNKFLGLCLLLITATSFAVVSTENGSNSISPKIFPPDATGKTLQAGTNIKIHKFEYDKKNNTFTAKTETVVSLTAIKYLLPENSTISGTCQKDFATITAINGVKVQPQSKYNAQISNDGALNTTCMEQNGRAKEIFIANDIKINNESNKLMSIPEFKQSYSFKIFSRQKFEIISIKTNSYQTMISFRNRADDFPSFGVFNAQKEVNVVNSHQTNLDNNTGINTVILDGVYKELVIPINNSGLFEIIQIED